MISDSLRAANLSKSISSLNHILSQLDSIVQKINRGKGTLGEVVNDDDLYYNLTAVTENLNRLLTEFRTNPKKFVNLSLISLGSGVKEGDNYGISVYESEKPLPQDSEWYLKYPDLLEYKSRGQFLYLIATYKNLKRAEKDLDKIKNAYPNAFIVKISQK